MGRSSRKDLDALQLEVETTLANLAKATLAHKVALQQYMKAKQQYRQYSEAMATGNKVISWQGEQYKQVHRQAQEGDVVVYLQSTSDGYLLADKPYAVRNVGGLLIAIGEDHTECLVYTSCSCPPLVYEKSVGTPNELRAEVIAEAKAFAARHRDTLYTLPQGVDFDQVYNHHISIAIALAKVLGVNYELFSNAPEPTLAIGQKILASASANLLTVQSITDEGYPANKTGVFFVTDYRIVDDTDAQYAANT